MDTLPHSADEVQIARSGKAFVVPGEAEKPLATHGSQAARTGAWALIKALKIYR